MSLSSSPVAYGLTLSGPLLDGALTPMLLDSAEPWPEVGMAWEPRELGRVPERLDEHSALLRCLFGGHLVADRAAMTATFLDGIRPGADVVAHPGLAGIGMIFARWLGRSAFHGGAVLGPSGAWGLVGSRGAGKSTTLAALKLAGHAVLADDLVVLEQGCALAGPRTLDLRPTAAEHLPGDFEVVTVRGGERRRLMLGPTPTSVPFRGWVFLGVARGVSVERIAPADRLAALGEHLAVRLLPRDPTAFLELASLPAYRLRRPLRWEELSSVVQAVEDLMASA